MIKDRITGQSDSILIPFLNADDDEQTEKALAELIVRHVEPEIAKNLRYRMRKSLKKEDFQPDNQDALEIAGEAKLLLIAKLRKLKLSRNGGPILNLKHYVDSVTINACHQYLREKYPMRHQLRHKLRYLLTHHPDFALWEIENEWLCGKQIIAGSSQTLAPAELEDGRQKNFGHNGSLENLELIGLVKILFDFAGIAVKFNDLLSLVADILDLKDKQEVRETDDFLLRDIPDENDILAEIEQREYLTLVWSEISELPLRHRAALLLNLRDKQGNGMIQMFPFLRIASIRNIAGVLDFSPEEFAAIWPELPWDDLRIAEHLGLTRQQVINLRQSARARLIRRIYNL
jgi:hypothetical protein